MEIQKNSDDGYFSDLDIEITKGSEKIYSKKIIPLHSSRKRLLCYSIIENNICKYNKNCTYAHTLNEQIIDDDKLRLFKLLVEKNELQIIMNNKEKTNNIYQSIFHLTNICDNCVNLKCAGGYNCKFGVPKKCMKVCKQDFLTGECNNVIEDIIFDSEFVDKMNECKIDTSETFKGCKNGHHLTIRGLIPYYVHIHSNDKNSEMVYNSVRKIDLDFIYKYFRNEKNSRSESYIELETDSSDDELSNIIDELMLTNYD